MGLQNRPWRRKQTYIGYIHILRTHNTERRHCVDSIALLPPSWRRACHLIHELSTWDNYEHYSKLSSWDNYSHYSKFQHKPSWNTDAIVAVVTNIILRCTYNTNTIVWFWLLHICYRTLLGIHQIRTLLQNSRHLYAVCQSRRGRGSFRHAAFPPLPGVVTKYPTVVCMSGATLPRYHVLVFRRRWYLAALSSLRRVVTILMEVGSNKRARILMYIADRCHSPVSSRRRVTWSCRR
jgi:hypothetical protein